MQRILVLMAHPAQSNSKANDAMTKAARSVDDVTLVDLYAAYPRHVIDIDAEQRRLLEHDIIVFQCPFFWYSTPPILKEWQDLVLEYGFAYGEGGNALAGKKFMAAFTVGGPRDAYHPDGYNRFEFRTLLSPLEATSNLCQMTFLPPFALFASLKARKSGEIAPHAEAYRALLEGLRDETIDETALLSQDVLTADSIADLTGEVAQ